MFCIRWRFMNINQLSLMAKTLQLKCQNQINLCNKTWLLPVRSNLIQTLQAMDKKPRTYIAHHSLPTGIRFPFLRGTGFRHKGHKRLFMSQRPMHSSWKWCSQGKRVIISFFFAILLLLRPGRCWIVHHSSRRSMQIAHDGVRVTIASNSDW
jgi:hypothetical protein